MKTLHSLLAITFVACGSLLLNTPALAHDGPEHEIEELNQRLRTEGESADLLLQRAIEYNVLGKTTEAFKDLERALTFDSHSPHLLRELSRAHLGFGRTNEALDAANSGLKYAAAGIEHASLLMTRAEVFRARKEQQKALEDADKAIKEHPENAEWYLARSQIHQALGLKKERIKGLEEGARETGSGLIDAEWIDALIDGGKGEQALARIEAELKDARLQSTWLIRRAKVRIAMKKKDEARHDLEAALAELNQRLGRSSSDPLLLMDRGHAHELLGNKEDAKKDYESARDKGVVDEWLREHLKAVGASDKKEERRPGSRRRGEEKPSDDKSADKADEKKDDAKDEKPADGDEQK
jgi:tetratricopeptide (TPR) repeat protein